MQNFWYCVAMSHELGSEEPLEVKILGRKVKSKGLKTHSRVGEHAGRHAFSFDCSHGSFIC